jgi:hypothetical protein
LILVCVLQRSSSLVDGRKLFIQGIATFTSSSLTGEVGEPYQLQVACRLGNVLIPTALPVSIALLGCEAGKRPVNLICTQCAPDEWSRGGSGPASECQRCPKTGATCKDGVLSLLPHHWRPFSEVNTTISADSTLLPCIHSAACFVNSSTETYGCQPGYTGPLCGTCDAENGFALFGRACAPCWLPALSTLLVAVLLILIIAVVFFVAWRSSGPAEADNSAEGKAAAAAAVSASVSLRILLTHVQALGALRAFKSTGTELFRSAFSWTEIISASPFSLGPLQCVIGWTYSTRFFLLASSPLLALSMVVTAVLVIAVFSAIGFKALAGCLRRNSDRLCKKRATSPVAAASSLAPSRQPIPSKLTTVANPLASARDLTVSTEAPPQMPAANPSASYDTLFDKPRFSRHLAGWWQERRFFGTLSTIASLAYMPIVGSSIAALACTDPIDGVRYLQADLSVVCDQGAHKIVKGFAIALLVLVGAGFPVGLLWRLWSVKQAQTEDPCFQSLFGPFTAGYRWKHEEQLAKGRGEQDVTTVRIPSRSSRVISARSQSRQPSSSTSPSIGRRQRLRGSVCGLPIFCGIPSSDGYLWYESVTFTRKLGVVLIATLVTDAAVQLASFSLLALCFFLLQMRLQPFESTRFNRLELAGLAALLVTCVLSVVLLPADAALEATALTGSNRTSGAFSFEARTVVVTLLLLFANGAVLAMMLAATTSYHLRSAAAFLRSPQAPAWLAASFVHACRCCRGCAYFEQHSKAVAREDLSASSSISTVASNPLSAPSVLTLNGNPDSGDSSAHDIDAKTKRRATSSTKGFEPMAM